jgi:hypothetical protein
MAVVPINSLPISDQKFFVLRIGVALTVVVPMTGLPNVYFASISIEKLLADFEMKGGVHNQHIQRIFLFAEK